jgi:hypothetical protein
MREQVKKMICHIYFDWNDKRDTVKEFGDKLKAACEKMDTKFLGIYGPHQDKWNFVAMVEAPSINDFLATFTEVGGMPEKMPHAIMKYFEKSY